MVFYKTILAGEIHIPKGFPPAREPPAYPGELRQAVIMKVAVPGVDPWPWSPLRSAAPETKDVTCGAVG
jgi:hypothetical protein